MKDKALARRRDRCDDDDDNDDDYDRPRHSRRPSNSDDAARRMMLGGIFAAVMIPLAIIFLIFVIVAIRIREAHRHGEGPFVQRPKDDDPPQPPPQPPVQQPPQPPPPPKMPANVGPDGFARTNVAGGAFDPQFEDRAPPGGILLGLDLGRDDDGITTIRPIYLVNGKEVQGKQLGAANPTIALKAKQGYAVSSLNVNAGLWLNGMTITFARLTNGKLDTKDTYETQYIGSEGGGRSIHGGNGMNIVGVLGKSSNNKCTGIGTVLK